MSSPTEPNLDTLTALHPSQSIPITHALSPKSDPDSPPPLQLDTTVDTSIHLAQEQQLGYYQDNEFISLTEQNDEKAQTYRMRFYSDDISSLPIFEILSRFQSQNNPHNQKKC